jgi:xylulokinase
MMRRDLVAGVDSSTQQTKLVLVDTATGELVHSSALPHPDGTELDPEHWWSALHAVGGTHPGEARALSIAAQQHGTILLDSDGNCVRPALLWNDLRAFGSARALRRELGDEAWLDAVGLLPDAAHPVSKLRWVADHEPAVARRIETVVLPHDWLTWRLLGRARAATTTDRSDASATGYWSPSCNGYRWDLAEHALGRAVRGPEVLAPDAVAGATDSGLIVAAGCGDNAATHLALGTGLHDMVISIGTSTTVTMRTDTGVHDRTGTIDTMADARDGFLPIIAMLNGARVLSATARMLGLSIEQLDHVARDAPVDAAGVVFVPHLDGERNPPAEAASGSLVGLSRHAMTPSIIARAVLLGLGCAIADAADALSRSCGRPGRITVVGGGARAASLRQVIADLIGETVEWPEHREHAAFGAAMQAAWSLTGSLPDWPPLATVASDPASDRSWVAGVRQRYRSALHDGR